MSGVSKAIFDALSIRPSQIEVDHPVVEGKKPAINKFQMRGRFAMWLADYKDGKAAQPRLGSVREAFNSPLLGTETAAEDFAELQIRLQP